VTQRVWELVEPLALSEGLELVDVQYRPEGGRTVLRLLIDRPAGGVTLDQLAALSREVSDLLDAHDVIHGRYHLECSSPGLDRPLVRPAHFARAVGARVRVRTRQPLEQRRQFRGVLESTTDDGVTVRDTAGLAVFVPFDAIEKANIEYDFARPTGASGTQA
jgi:ribosome maturation factor RimP